MPDEAHMAWNLTFLIVHFAALIGFIFLYRSAPCWMQKLAVIGFALGMAILTISSSFALIEVNGHRHLTALGLAVEHIAVLLYVFRLIYQGQQEWKPSSAPFPNSSR